MRALVVVDVQHDFVEGGSLAVAGGKAVARAIEQHLREVSYHAVFASRDWHNPGEDNGGHFAADPDYVTTWPVHCVSATPGADYEIDFPAGVTVQHVIKGMGKPAYSAFEGVTAAADGTPGTPHESLAARLREQAVSEVVVVGIATDHCVKATALDAAAEGFEVTVLADLTAGVGAGSTAVALDQLRAAGVTVR